MLCLFNWWTVSRCNWFCIFEWLLIYVSFAFWFPRYSRFLTRVGFNVHVEKSILCPVSRLDYLGVDIDLVSACPHVLPATLSVLRSAIAKCDEFWPSLWRQRLAGYLNFVRPCLKLPLELGACCGGRWRAVAPPRSFDWGGRTLVRQTHLPPNSDFSSDFGHFILKIWKNLKFLVSS